MNEIVDRLLELLASEGRRQYGGERVSQCEHALQCAALAESEGAEPAVVAAALLHDIGHLLHREGAEPARRGIDDRHETVGADALALAFGPAVAEPVRLHVAAKRYLCATDSSYFDRLSPGSVRSLRLQGGPFADAEAARFRALPFAPQAIRVRQWDETAKSLGRQTPNLEHFRAALETALVG